jgi:hypothetical protein
MATSFDMPSRLGEIRDIDRNWYDLYINSSGRRFLTYPGTTRIYRFLSKLPDVEFNPNNQQLDC